METCQAWPCWVGAPRCPCANLHDHGLLFTRVQHQIIPENVPGADDEIIPEEVMHEPEEAWLLLQEEAEDEEEDEAVVPKEAEEAPVRIEEEETGRGEGGDRK